MKKDHNIFFNFLIISCLNSTETNLYKTRYVNLIQNYFKDILTYFALFFHIKSGLCRIGASKKKNRDVIL